jgi:hypothetical protein
MSLGWSLSAIIADEHEREESALPGLSETSSSVDIAEEVAELLRLFCEHQHWQAQVQGLGASPRLLLRILLMAQQSRRVCHRYAQRRFLVSLPIHLPVNIF